MTARILFVCLGSKAFGEAVMALDLARRLDGRRFRCAFLTSPNIAVLLGDHPELQALELQDDAHAVNRLLVGGFVDGFEPSLVILCDFLTFAFSQSSFGLTLEDVRAWGAPVASLDCYEWESGDFVIDFLNGTTAAMPDTLVDMDGVLRPCPLNRPASIRGRTVCYSFLDAPSAEGSLPRREEARRRLGLDPEQPLFLTTEALWQRRRPRSFEGPFLERVDGLLGWYLRRLGRPCTWMRVGLVESPARRIEGGVDERHLPSLPEGEFETLLAAADLFVSTNVAATSLGKCLRLGTPALLLYNSRAAAGEEALLGQGVSARMRALLRGSYPLRPFLMYPMGWFEFLGPVLTDNPFVDTIHRAEILDEEEVLGKLRAAADGVLAPLEAERAAYLARLDELPSPDECLDHLLSAVRGDAPAAAGQPG